MPCVIYRKLPAGKLPQYAGVYTIDAEGRVFEERAPIQLHTERIGHRICWVWQSACTIDTGTNCGRRGMAEADQ